MPYFVTDTAEGCAGWATVKEGGEVIGCHDTKDAAVAQMVAVSLGEGIEPGGEYSAARVLPDNYRPALSEDVPEGRACGNCVFYNEAKIEGDKAYCEKWDDYVSGAYYCNAWEPDDGGDDDGEEDEARVLIDVPQYIQEAAEKGLTYERNGYAGEGLTDQTIEEARQLRAGQVEDDKVTRMRAWILRHRGDWEGVARNNNPDDEDFPGPGAVAAYLWGVDPTAENGTQRVLEWADGVLAPLETEERFDVKELETRALPMGDFTVTEGEDGQKTFTGYAALFGAPSSGLPFTEVIAPGAFRRTLSRVADGKKIVSFLFGHDETRALATTASGRLALTEDERGLKVEARLDPADPDAAGVISKLTHEARAMGMSFGFTIPKNGDEWDEDTRTLREVNLFEVSVLSAGQTPAYPATLGLTSVRKIASRMGVDGDRLITAIESLKSATPLTEADVEVIETVTEKLAPKRTGLDSSIARAKLLLAEMESESL
jgi:HK97 family phage prohead protease